MPRHATCLLGAFDHDRGIKQTCASRGQRLGEHPSFPPIAKRVAPDDHQIEPGQQETATDNSEDGVVDVSVSSSAAEDACAHSVASAADVPTAWRHYAIRSANDLEDPVPGDATGRHLKRLTAAWKT